MRSTTIGSMFTFMASPPVRGRFLAASSGFTGILIRLPPVTGDFPLAHSPAAKATTTPHPSGKVLQVFSLLGGSSFGPRLFSSRGGICGFEGCVHPWGRSAGNMRRWGCSAGNMRRWGHLLRTCAPAGTSRRNMCTRGDTPDKIQPAHWDCDAFEAKNRSHRAVLVRGVTGSRWVDGIAWLQSG
jgi:hypothetical protein